MLKYNCWWTVIKVNLFIKQKVVLWAIKSKKCIYTKKFPQFRPLLHLFILITENSTEIFTDFIFPHFENKLTMRFFMKAKILWLILFLYVFFWVVILVSYVWFKISACFIPRCFLFSKLLMQMFSHCLFALHLMSVVKLNGLLL